MTLLLVGTASGKQAVLAFFGGGSGGEPALDIVGIRWILIGRNLMLSTDLVEGILSIKSDSRAGEDKDIAKEISEAVSSGLILPIRDKSLMAGKPDTRRNVGEWLFAAGFDFYNELAVGKFLFQDNAYYGIAISGKFFEKWFGKDLTLSAIYFKGSRPEEDRLRVALNVPGFDFGPFKFDGGAIALEIMMNGGFKLDIGFPWRNHLGSRRWERTFGAFVTPFQGSGGAYFAYLKPIVPTKGSKVKLVQLEAGYAVQAGMGGSLNGGIFRAWARAGIYYIIDGTIVLEEQTPRGIRLTGTIGILVEARGELNWWVVSVSVGLRVTAEARLTLAWGLDPDSPILSDATDDEIYVQLNFMLSARAYAKACIGSGIFKICKEISVSVSLPYKQRIVLKEGGNG